jgi:hypothetical protein
MMKSYILKDRLLKFRAMKTADAAKGCAGALGVAPGHGGGSRASHVRRSRADTVSERQQTRGL